MDAMENNSASATVAEVAENAEMTGQEVEARRWRTTIGRRGSGPARRGGPAAAQRRAGTRAGTPARAEPEPAAAAAPESGAGKGGKKRKSAPKPKTAATKSLVVFREGKVHYRMRRSSY